MTDDFNKPTITVSLNSDNMSSNSPNNSDSNLWSDIFEETLNNFINPANGLIQEKTINLNEEEFQSVSKILRKAEFQ